MRTSLAGHPLFAALLLSWALIAVGAWLVLSFIPAPYGRFAREGSGPGVRRGLAWCLMELPGLAIFSAILIASRPVRRVLVRPLRAVVPYLP